MNQITHSYGSMTQETELDKEPHFLLTLAAYAISPHTPLALTYFLSSPSSSPRPPLLTLLFSSPSPTPLMLTHCRPVCVCAAGVCVRRQG